MSPQSKRESSNKTEQDVQAAKRVKGDIIESNTTEKANESTQLADKPEKHSLNNNNNTSSTESNGKDKNAKDDEQSKANGKVKVEKPNTEPSGNIDGEQAHNKKPEEKREAKTSDADTKPEIDSTTAESEPQKDAEPEESKTGTLIIFGGANWDMTGRKELPKSAKKPADVHPGSRNLWGPHRVSLDGVDTPLRVRGVFSGCNACHSVIVTDEGLVMTFGRNDKGQLGLGDTEIRTIPTVVEALRGIDIIAAACGRSHTLFLSSEGLVFSAGDNKMGQCGTNQQSVHTITTPVRIAFKEDKPIVKVACGAEFSMIVDDEGRLYSFGHPEHGQLGHNSEGKYFTSGNKYAFHCEYAPRRIVTFIEKSREGHVSPVDEVFITDVACGTNHSLAVDKRHRCYSWGFGGYHRLGHSETKNELVPRSIKVFDGPPNSGRGCSRVYAGATHSMALDYNGLLYFWGQNKSSGEATMYPKTVQDLCGWRITAVACANRSIFVIADETCISWGPSPTYGELGYGEGKSKSSTTPQEVKTLEGVHAMDVACGFGHTLLIARDSKSEDQSVLKKLKSWP